MRCDSVIRTDGLICYNNALFLRESSFIAPPNSVITKKMHLSFKFRSKIIKRKGTGS
jgi:hypothetical protein